MYVIALDYPQKIRNFTVLQSIEFNEQKLHFAQDWHAVLHTLISAVSTSIFTSYKNSAAIHCSGSVTLKVKILAFTHWMANGESQFTLFEWLNWWQDVQTNLEASSHSSKTSAITMSHPGGFYNGYYW